MTDTVLIGILILAVAVNVYQRWQEVQQHDALLHKLDLVLNLLLVWREVWDKSPTEQKAAIDKVR